MTLVDERYRNELARWSGQERVRRCAALLDEVKAMLARKLAASEPGLCEHDLKRRVAECLYRTDPRTQRLLSRLGE